jgi:glycosyltransferase involved in cell wall biosynthesis
MTQANPVSFVLITPARNEEALIGDTIRSVIAQTRRPLRWIIVSDGSTDRTDDIVREYATQHAWIELLRMPERKDRNFAAKAHSVNAAYEKLKPLRFEVVGNLDADVTFDPDFFAFLVGRFDVMEDLGVAGTPYVEDGERPDQHVYARSTANLDHVSGQCQMFRRGCFEQIGGYMPIKGGAIDWVAVTTARMRGWKTRTFLDKVFYHHRKMGTAESSRLRARFHYGRKAYYVGGHPAWEILRGVFQMGSTPYVIGGMCFICGYVWAAATRMQRAVPPELMTFHRGEQLTRLKHLLRLQ